MDAGTLRRAIEVECPVTFVRIGLTHDRTTWTFTPGTNATDAEKTAAQYVINTIDDPPSTRGRKQVV